MITAFPRGLLAAGGIANPSRTSRSHGDSFGGGASGADARCSFLTDE